MNIARILIVALTLTTLSLTAHAQGGPAGPGPGPRAGAGPPQTGDRPMPPGRVPAMRRLSPEEAEAAWTLQAQGVARGLGLSQENTPAFIDAYLKSRHAVQEGLDKLREERPPRGAGRAAPGAPGSDEDADRPRRRQPGASGRSGDNPRAEQLEKRNALLASEKDRLRGELSAMLTGAQLDYAVAVLGTFSSAWDVMVNAVAEFKLGEEKTFEALKPIEVYIADTADLERGSRDNQRERMQATRDARNKLLEAMKTVLNDEQWAAFQRAVPGGRARGRDMLQRWDENGDGVLQRTEVPEQMQRMFDRLDADGDGVLNEEELQAGSPRGPGGRAGGRPGRGSDAP